MVETTNQAIRTQIEYYMSDKNLARDKFFRDQIATSKDGYIAIQHFMNCNKVKTQGWTLAQIKEACADSTDLEIKGDTCRRTGNKALPERAAVSSEVSKRREQKAADKAAADAQATDEYDEDGRVILVEKDFDNPVIVSYTAKVASGEEFKVDWKCVEKAIKEAFPKLKLIYSRMDPHGGHVAFSQLRIKRDLLDALCKKPLTI